jgi:prolyl oligopeptidase
MIDNPASVSTPPALIETAADGADPYLWLEDVTGDDAMVWVRARNAETHATLESDPDFAKLEADILEVLDSKDKIPVVSKRGPYYYNFWKDAEHPRGLWRRTTPESYRQADPAWEVVLDIDALGRQEGKAWVFAGATFLEPDFSRCIVSLSPGGSDTTVKREFDLVSKRFVDGGFTLPEAKSSVSWIDRDTLFVSTDFGPGSMTASGYTRVAKRWRRGMPLVQATLVFEGKTEDVSISAWHDPTPGFERDFVGRATTFFTSETYVVDVAGTPRKLDLPDDAEPSVHKEWLLVHLRTPWAVGGKTYPAGALLATRLDAFMAGARALTVLFEPTASTSLTEMTWTASHLVLKILDDVKSRLTVLTPGEGAWRAAPFTGAPAIGTIWVDAIERDSDEVFMTTTGFLTPTTLYQARLGEAPRKLKEMPAFFDATGVQVTQHFATSKDGTRVPYFEVAPQDMVLDGSHRTLLSGYGGFEVSEVPFYSGGIGRAWLAQGGVYVLANIRGGGEYGPRWHEAALKENRHRAYEDFAAIAADLVRRGVTVPSRLGIQGGSNGGLLMGNMITTYPALFGAVVCEVPLLDMRRYSKLLAGASWVGEYGDPDKPEEWAYIQTFSPYHNLRAGVAYPPVLFTTSTRDDRVHPGHARKMMEKMRGLGCDVSYYENIEGGHGGAADNRQAAHKAALAYIFLRQKLH